MISWTMFLGWHVRWNLKTTDIVGDKCIRDDAGNIAYDDAAKLKAWKDQYERLLNEEFHAEKWSLSWKAWGWTWRSCIADTVLLINKGSLGLGHAVSAWKVLAATLHFAPLVSTGFTSVALDIKLHQGHQGQTRAWWLLCLSCLQEPCCGGFCRWGFPAEWCFPRGGSNLLLPCYLLRLVTTVVAATPSLPESSLPGKYRAFSLTNRGISLKSRGRVFSSGVRGVLLYASETWPLNAVDTSRLVKNDNNGCTSLNNAVYWHCKTHAHGGKSINNIIQEFAERTAVNRPSDRRFGLVIISHSHHKCWYYEAYTTINAKSKFKSHPKMYIVEWHDFVRSHPILR